MKTKTFTPLGSLHPILFFAGVYIVALLFSIFICSSLFYSCNSSQASTDGQDKGLVVEKSVASNTTTPVESIK